MPLTIIVSNVLLFYYYLGWEAFNALIKSLYHRHTQKGGNMNSDQQSHLKGVIRYLFREMLFRTGDGEHYFTDIKYPGRDPVFYARTSTYMADNNSVSEPATGTSMTQESLEALEQGQLLLEEDGLHHWEMEGGDDDDDSTMNRDNILGGLTC